jgi:hypothetical protein
MKKPSDRDFEKRVGKKVKLWRELRAYISKHYDHEPVLSVGKKEYDWTVRYRKSGRTLVTLMPEENALCVLVVLGKDEVEKTKNAKLNTFVKNVFTNAKQYHDGKWLFIRPRNKQDIESIKTLLTIKRKPKTA